MDEFKLHECLLTMESVAGQYSGGINYIPEIQKVRRQLSSRQYRVAVIGEFKRGKSSLINAIIGSQVLPTDILPMTAAITRVTYGPQKKILIHFKDGHTEEKSVEELLEYATKYDAQKAQMASSIREIVVYYPSVFCQNHIDILDTPGLNDNESMTDVTYSVLGDVDAAMVVISATHPMSMTEQKLILDLIEQRQIRHLIFIVTHIDSVSRRNSEKDRMIAFIKDRISQDVLQSAEEKFREDPFLLEKARNILRHPDLFGVSSVQAMEGFVQDNWDLLEESRFPYFKSELLSLLTAAQSTDIVEKVSQLGSIIENSLEDWFRADEQRLQKKQVELKLKLNQISNYYAKAGEELNLQFLALDEDLNSIDCNMDTLEEMFRQNILRMFVIQLGKIRKYHYTEQTIRSALDFAYGQSLLYMQEFNEQKLTEVQERILQETTQFGQRRLDMGFSGKMFAEDLKSWMQKPMPILEWKCSPLTDAGELMGVDVIVQVNRAIEASIPSFVTALKTYIAQWRVVLLHRNKADMADREPMDRLMRALESAENEVLFTRRNHQNNLKKMEIMTGKPVREEEMV